MILNKRLDEFFMSIENLVHLGHSPHFHQLERLAYLEHLAYYFGVEEVKF